MSIEPTEPNEFDEDTLVAPSFDPECPESEQRGIECEFENRDGSWWCTTHNCWA